MNNNTELSPVIFTLSEAGDAAEVARLREQGVPLRGDLKAQVLELARSREAATDPPRPPDARVQEVLAGRSLEAYGRVIYLPWQEAMYHLLPEEDYVDLRSSRNRNKILREEQELMRGLKVGVVGLSVGSIIARVVHLEGLAGELRLADPDHFEISNLNRVLVGIPDLGLNKAVSAARRIWESDPYARLRLFEEGVTAENLPSFFGQGEQKLDVVIEECDCLHMKLKIREFAKEMRVPVIMVTDDRGMLDVERFDQEPERPPFHGLLGDLRSDDLRRLSGQERMALVYKILAHQPSPRLHASFAVMGQGEVSGWPQLGSEVVLGAAQVAACLRKLALGKPLPSRRTYIDEE